MNDPYMGQTIDSVLGQEFLTWLWFRHETNPLGFKGTDGQAFSIAIEQRVVVQGGEGETKETTSFTGSSLSDDGFHLPMREARLGLCTGKKVTRALLRFEQGELAWQATLKADDFSFGSFRTPKVEHEQDDDPDAIFLEKMYLMEKALTMFDRAYAEFLAVRVAVNAWHEEVKAMGAWMIRQE